MSWTIQMNWRCSHCKNLNPGMEGKERESLRCVKCGAEKTNEEWIMPGSPETAPRLTGELDRKARLGPNWPCKYCKAESRADKRACETCGAARYDAAPRNTPPKAPPDKHPKEPAPKSIDELRDLSKKDPDALWGIDWEVLKNNPPPVEPPKGEYGYRTAPHVEPPKPKQPTYEDLVEEESIVKSFKSRWSDIDSEAWFKGLLIVGSTALFIGLMIWLFTPNSTVAQVSVMAWTRTSDLQERHSYDGEGWRKNAPAGVYAWTHCETRQNGTHDCNPHDCNCHNVPYECRCSGGTPYSCNCRTNCSPNRNGSATCSESCSTCTTPRVCSTCSREECSTCYDQCPTMEDWCTYRYYQWDSLNRIRLAGGGHTAQWPEVERGIYQNPLFPHRTLREDEYAIRWNDTASYRQWRRTYSFDRYERFSVGDLWEVEWTRAGGFTLMRRKRR